MYIYLHGYIYIYLHGHMDMYIYKERIPTVNSKIIAKERIPTVNSKIIATVVMADTTIPPIF